MNEAQFVNVFQGQRGLSHVELGGVLGKRVFLHKQSHQVATRKELHDEVEIGHVLKKQNVNSLLN